MVLDELVKFAKQHHEGFAQVPDEILKQWLLKYQKTILVYYKEDRSIGGFGIYQDWPDFLNFIAIIGTGSPVENLRAMLKGRDLLPDKPIWFFDEQKMKARRLCRQ